jgi:tight adherence protein B
MNEMLIIAGVGLICGLMVWFLLVGLLPAPEDDSGGPDMRRALIELLLRRSELIAMGASMSALAVWLIFAHPLMSFLTLVGLIFFPNKYYAWRHKKRIELIDSQVPDMLAMTAGAISAGASLMVALESVARDGPSPIKLELEIMLREVRLGTDLDQALDHLAARLKSEEMIMVAAAIKIARESGGNLSESLERLSRAVRDRQNMEKKIVSLTAQGRAQGLAMAGLPFFFLYALFQLDPIAMGSMFYSILGWAVFLAVCIWITIGFKIMKRIMDIDI